MIYYIQQLKVTVQVALVNCWHLPVVFDPWRWWLQTLLLERYRFHQTSLLNQHTRIRWFGNSSLKESNDLLACADVFERCHGMFFARLKFSVGCDNRGSRLTK